GTLWPRLAKTQLERWQAFALALNAKHTAQIVGPSPCPREAHHFRGLLAGHNRPQPFIPNLQRIRFAFEHVRAHVMAHQNARFLGAGLVAHDRRNKIERYPHLRQHSRERSSKIMRSEYGYR